MNSFQRALVIYKDRQLFEEIHNGKKAFLRLLENISNRIVLDDLSIIHTNHKGTKISKGNELERCPYQVLDLIRDFDPDSGLNIRVLHWWGRGIFLFVLAGEGFFYGKELLIKLKDNPFSGFYIAQSSSPFAYSQLVADYELKKMRLIDSSVDFSDFGRFQLMKEIPYGFDFFETEELLYTELQGILSMLNTYKKQ